MKCDECKNSKALIKRPRSGLALCTTCFFASFEAEVHQTITGSQMFKFGDRIAIGASGGKDSTVLAYVLNLLNKRHNYGLDLHLLSIDEGIQGYRDDSLATVHQNKLEYGLPLTVLSYKDLYGWSMDAIVERIGKRNNCTFCGVFRRQALDRGARQLGCRMIATGHNADDLAETLLLNLFRGDRTRLGRSTLAVTHDIDDPSIAIGCGSGNSSEHPELSYVPVPRCKPFKFTHEKDIVLYAYFKKLTYFSTECPYAPDAYRGHVREFIKRLERVRPTVIVNLIKAGDEIHDRLTRKMTLETTKVVQQIARSCTRCGYITSSQDGICKACLLLEGLNTDNPFLGVYGKSRKKYPTTTISHDKKAEIKENNGLSDDSVPN